MNRFLVAITFVFVQSSPPDSSFLIAASQANAAEIAAGKLASSVSRTEAVINIAKMMVIDHSAAQKDLVTLADRHNIAISQEPDMEHQETIAQLSRLSGSAFDSLYLKTQFHDHQLAITLFQQESQDGKDDADKSYALKYLPNLRNHLSMIKLHNGMMTDSKLIK